MTLFTPKGLIKPEYPENADVDQLNDNMDRLDQYGMGPFVCTSATRPTGSNRWDGMLIWETDTKRLLHWRDAEGAWRPLMAPETYTEATPVTGFSFTADYNTPSLKLHKFGDFYFLKGGLTKVGGSAVGNGTTFVTLNAAFAPPTVRGFGVWEITNASTPANSVSQLLVVTTQGEGGIVRAHTANVLSSANPVNLQFFACWTNE